MTLTQSRTSTEDRKHKKVQNMLQSWQITELKKRGSKSDCMKENRAVSWEKKNTANSDTAVKRKKDFFLKIKITHGTYKIVWSGIISEFNSVQFSCSVVSDSLQLHELQHARPPCPWPTPRVYSNACPSSRWCHPAISSSAVPFFSCPQSLPSSGSFPMSQLFASGGQSIGVSASASVLPVNTQDWSPLGWTGWISLRSKGLSRVFPNTTVQKHQFFSTWLSL